MIKIPDQICKIIWQGTYCSFIMYAHTRSRVNAHTHTFNYDENLTQKLFKIVKLL